MELKPLKNSFLFEFVNDTAGGQFIEKNKGSIILTNQDLSHQGKFARFVRVKEIGKDVTAFKPGDLVLVEALMWTREVKFGERSIWKSDETKVIGVALDESVIYAY
jgi:hypothetical protein